MQNPNDRRNAPMSNLVSKFDLDPGRWRPLFYPVFIDVGVLSGSIGRGQITLNNQPFIYTRLQHQIVGNTADPMTSGLWDDGMYTIEMKDEQSNYQKDPVLAETAYGSINKGFASDLPFPIPWSGNRTINFTIVNLVDRVLTPEAEIFKVALTMHGIADWGELRQQGM